MCTERLSGTPKLRMDFHAARKQSAKMQWELKHIERTEERIEEDLDKLVDALPRRLSFIKIRFKGATMPQGPVTLQQGQSSTATVDYFDQNGNQMSPSSTFTPPTVTYKIDHPEFASSNPLADGQSDLETWVAEGVANLTAVVQGPHGPPSLTRPATCRPVRGATHAP